MTEEYMPEYREFFGPELIRRASRRAWAQVAMAAFCFIWCVFMFTTPMAGGAGFLMITPENGAVGLAQLLPWCSIVMGVLVALGALANQDADVLGYADAAIAAIMVVAGLWGIFNPYAMTSFSTVYTVGGVLIALYLALTACELYRRGSAWIPVAVCAAASWFVTMLGAFGFASDAVHVAYSCIAFFIAAWGFVFGARGLSD